MAIIYKEKAREFNPLGLGYFLDVFCVIVSCFSYRDKPSLPDDNSRKGITNSYLCIPVEYHHLFILLVIISFQIIVSIFYTVKSI